VNARGVRHHCQVRPIVDDYDCPIRICYSDKPVAQLEKTIGREILGANLDTPRASIHEGARQVRGLPARALRERHIDDGVEWRE
jgi:hypothetical protein